MSVTGPRGEVLAESEYGGPAEFDSYLATEGQWVIVPQADVELWIDGFRDERWRLKITTPSVDKRVGHGERLRLRPMFILDGDRHHRAREQPRRGPREHRDRHR